MDPTTQRFSALCRWVVASQGDQAEVVEHGAQGTMKATVPRRKCFTLILRQDDVAVVGLLACYD